MGDLYKLTNLSDHGDIDFLPFRKMTKTLGHIFSDEEKKRLDGGKLVSVNFAGHIVWIEKSIT